MVLGNSRPGKYVEDSKQEAHFLADQGAPIFTCPLNRAGDPFPPKAWEQTEPGQPSHDAVDSWKTGMGLCMVTGVVFDVVDIDPRNGGALSIKRLWKELGDDGTPYIYWRVETPSGGSHLYIGCLGIGTRPGFLPGIDLKGGMPDGGSARFRVHPADGAPEQGMTGPRRTSRPSLELETLNGQVQKPRPAAQAHH